MSCFRSNLLFVVMVLCTSLWPQTAPQPVYVESLRQWPGKIEEKTVEVNLDKSNPSYQSQITELHGKPRYKLSFTPMRVGSEDDKILYWVVSLMDIKHPIYANLLLPSRNPDFNQGAAGHVARLDANLYALVPLMAKRIIKVDQFYCVVQVQKYHLLMPQSSYVDSMSVEVKFTNKNPLGLTENN